MAAEGLFMVAATREGGLEMAVLSARAPIIARFLRWREEEEEERGTKEVDGFPCS